MKWIMGFWAVGWIGSGIAIMIWGKEYSVWGKNSDLMSFVQISVGMLFMGIAFILSKLDRMK